jgi:hypothetical protein
MLVTVNKRKHGLGTMYIHSIEDGVKLLAAIYRKCRSVMLSLGAGPDLVQTYKELTLEDLTSQTALIDPLLPGQRNKVCLGFGQLMFLRMPKQMIGCQNMSSHLTVLNDQHLIVTLKFSGFNGCVPR